MPLAFPLTFVKSSWEIIILNTNRKKNTGGEKSPVIFYLLIAAVILWFLATQIFGSDQSVPEISEKDMIFTGSFTWEKADGSIEPISVPGRYELPAGETMTIRTTFPSIMTPPRLRSAPPCRTSASISTESFAPNIPPEPTTVYERILPAAMRSAIHPRRMPGRNS